MKNLFLIGSMVFAIFQIADWLTPYDTTDDVINKKRSGMALYTDHQTGCEYLQGSSWGAITPRTDRDGHHLGCR